MAAALILAGSQAQAVANTSTQPGYDSWHADWSEFVATEDIWRRLRSGMALPEATHPRIAAQQRWYIDHPEYLKRVSQRSAPYLYLVADAIESRNMPMEFALLPVLESAYDPFAYSHGRAAGMWQIIPGTGRELGLKQNWWYDGRRDVRASTDAALTYLSRLAKRFDGDWLRALAAYNGGPARVTRAERRNRQLGRSTDFWALDLPEETENYVPRLLALADIVKNPGKHGIALSPIPDRPALAVVATQGQIDLTQAASLAEVDINTLCRLNPGLNRWATPPEGPHELLLPLESGARFEQGMRQLSKAERLQWVRYTVRRGDTLSGISSRYNTEAGVIRSVNKLTSSRITAGDSLMIPIARAPLERYALSEDQRLASRQERGKGYRRDYTVKSGDSFWRIANLYGVSTRKLAEWNNMAVRDPIRPGQKLVIWTSEPVSSATISAVDLQLPERGPMTRKLSYRVRSGDSLASIAARFNVRTTDILNWNKPLKGKKYIHPGDRITLFVDVRET